MTTQKELREAQTTLEMEGDTTHRGDASAGDASTQTPTVTSSTPRVEPRADEGPEQVPEAERYSTGQTIGKGGMGEVRIARDRRVGRTVALKVMLEDNAADPDFRRRFITEARVQGQLEHPAVVPVYDVGRDSEGRTFFAMKRIGGLGLDEVVRGLRQGDPEIQAEYNVRRLLTIFQQICLAIDYAHKKGVIHRDIKPNNLMVGGFGEVYVLDWGVAKLDGEVMDQDVPVPLSGSFEHDLTGADHVLGTIGYMAPEQIESCATVDALADVYSLGAVLFYLMAQEPLNGQGPAAERAEATMEGRDARPSRYPRGRYVPPEIDAICVRATALRPKDRYPSARALHDDIARYLDGDRDTKLRTRLAEGHLTRALEAEEAASRHGPEAAEHRRKALRRAARALALDPENPRATGMVARLLLEPPSEPPPEVVAERAQFAHDEAARTLNLGAATIVGFLTVALLLFWVGVRSWAAIAWMGAPLMLAVLVAVFARQKARPSLMPYYVAMAILVCLTIAWSGSVAGPLWLPPLYGTVFVAIVAVTHGLGRARLFVVAMTAVAVTAPGVLELLGVIGPAYEIVDGNVVVHANAVAFDPVRARVALILNSLGSIVLLTAILFRFSDEDVRNRDRLHLMVWHLRQLAPQGGDDTAQHSRVTMTTDPPPHPADDSLHESDTRNAAPRRED